jgi:uncharacterized protein
MEYTAPGVYVEEISALPPSIVGVATATPAFIGYTAKAVSAMGDDLTLKPTCIFSLTDYESLFGLAAPETKISVGLSVDANNRCTGATAALDEAARSRHMMWYALRLYFDHGGGPCFICSVGGYKDLTVDDLADGLSAVGREDGPTLILFPEAQYLPAADYKALHELALQQCADLRDRFVIMDMHDGTDAPNGAVLNNPARPDIVGATKDFRDRAAPNGNLSYGAVYAPNIVTAIGVVYDPGEIGLSVAGQNFGLNDLKYIDRQAYEMVLAALGGLTARLPPSGAIAGLYTANDAARGVWKVPANMALAKAIQPTIQIADAEQETMNIDSATGKSVNALRAFARPGTLVWGARTLAGNDNEWRYVNMRRLCIYLETSIRKAMAPFVFEPNDAVAWLKVKAMIETFLMDFWRQGGLAGARASHAFDVAIGLGSTMTSRDILEGRMIAEVNFCPLRPGEFIALRFVQPMPGA